MTPAPDPLAELRPLHLPSPVSWWPPAPGWWLLALLGLMLVVAGFFWWRRRAPRRAALCELRRLETSSLPAAQLAAALSILLRRYALACYPPGEVAGLTGDSWLRFLAAHGRAGDFLSGSGKALCQTPFQATPRVDRDDLFRVVRHWIKANPGRTRNLPAGFVEPKERTIENSFT